MPTSMALVPIHGPFPTRLHADLDGVGAARALVLPQHPRQEVTQQEPTPVQQQQGSHQSRAGGESAGCVVGNHAAGAVGRGGGMSWQIECCFVQATGCDGVRESKDRWQLRGLDMMGALTRVITE